MFQRVTRVKPEFLTRDVTSSKVFDTNCFGCVVDKSDICIQTLYVQTNMNTIEKTHPGTSLKSLPVLFAALCVLLCLSGCRPKPYPSLLLAADSLASVLPDSACALLASYAADTADEPLYVRMYYRLLCIKAKDKAYIVHTSDSAILPVVAYYEQHKRLPHLPEAYYYAGRVYRDLGDAPQALAYFQRALDAMREDKDRVDMTVKKLVLSQMGTLFKGQDLDLEALDAYRQSLQCSELMGDSVGMIYSNRDIGHTFVLLEQRDSALYYYQCAYQLSLLLGKKQLGNGVQALMTRLYMQKENYEAAHRSLQIALQDVSKNSRSGTYSIAARYYYEVGQIDSAVWYMEQLQDVGNLYTKEEAARGLAEITLAEGKTVPAARYLYQALLLGDSIRKLTKTDEVRSAHSHYNYQLREQENQRLKLQNLRQRQTNVAILVMFVLFACGGTLYYLHRRKVMRLRLQVAEQLQAEAYRNSRQFVEDNREHIHRLETRIQELNTQLQGSSLQCEQLQQQIDILSHMNRQVELEQNKRLLDQDLFSQSEIYALFRQKLATGQAVTSAEWSRFAEQLDSAFDGFTQKLGRLGQLKEKEWRASLPSKARFKNKEIAALLFLSPEGVSSLRRRLCAKFFQNGSEAKEWDKFILSL